MPWRCATHSGPFHADDVLAMALTRSFLDADATVERTRDPERLAQADLVFDVGAVFDPATHRFDHHQAAYEGPLSSAGMVLSWLQDAGHLPTELARHLDDGLVTYVDDVDNGRRAPVAGVPCFASMVDAVVLGATEVDLNFNANVNTHSDGKLLHGIGGWQNAAESRNVTRELVARGYTEDEIAKIWSGNLLRVWRRAESFAQSH